MDVTNSHEAYMRECLEEARRAGEAGEVPVGALVVGEGGVIARAGNAPIGTCDPTAHAELRALRAAASALANYRLIGTTVYVTLEPCPMCVGAMIHARVGHLVFGAADPKSGAAGSVFDLAGAPEHNHRLMVTGGVLAEECSAQLRAFFRARRAAGGEPCA
ncbi:MAG: tRNA adenosine(34) deaminase TadA [Halofilum sp. (in: g-proteobacteria)]